jgi:molybdenum cofactor biosynthesis protein B
MSEEKDKFISLKIGIITVSDTRNAKNDTSGAYLSEAIKQSGHEISKRVIVKDSIEQIRNILHEWTSENAVDVIITTGGTGLTGRDKTPEAIEPLLDKRIDGFAALFHQISSTKIGTSTIQSRAFGGIYKNRYIFSLPGSTNACKDAWDGILKHQLNINHKPCNLVEIIPRLSEK